ncbi:hypothetical protein NQZ68_004031 [Dissostichus eleginoides]|nr:hypothetical protein NQZ68_004031 [Dissostichus eleginoides]
MFPTVDVSYEQCWDIITLAVGAVAGGGLVSSQHHQGVSDNTNTRQRASLSWNWFTLNGTAVPLHADDMTC